MKKFGLFAVSFAAAFATVVSVSSSAQVSLQDGGAPIIHSGSSAAASSSTAEKFMPRFDGLRFIETLITAHR
ncbi:hypothetical protein RJT34_31252 [Clitoria ternatea]|uniref:Uncharacterized protein n=1 Tax=Clitoria ternatea TaxID=43366 RepID=A0AAN9F1S2_CLITE